MQSVSVTYARQNLSRLLADVEQGKSVMITRHGQNVAQLVPPPIARPLPDMKEFRSRFHVRGKPLSQIVIEARRNARY